MASAIFYHASARSAKCFYRQPSLFIGKRYFIGKVSVIQERLSDSRCDESLLVSTIKQAELLVIGDERRLLSDNAFYIN